MPNESESINTVPAASIRAGVLPGAQPVIAVLDTNVWLDWLIFDDPSTRLLKDADLLIVACDSMRAELGDVLSRPKFKMSESAQVDRLREFDARVHLRSMPANSVTRLRCTDRADQQFLELAVAAAARYLFTQDKALLKLARKSAREHDLTILPAAHWHDG